MQAPECTGCNDRERLAHSAVDVDGLGSNARVDQLTPVEADARTISRARCCDVSAHVIAVPPPRSIAELIEALPRVWPPSTPPEQAAEPADLRTTVLLQNLPRAMEVGDVCCFLDQLGLACAYNVVLMPTGKRRPRRTKGHAMVNFVCPGSAAACIELCDGMVLRDARCPVTCSAALAECQSESFFAKSMSTHLQRQAASSSSCCRMLGVT